MKLTVLLLILLIVLLFGCSYVTYTGNKDGSTKATGIEFGTTTALSGANFSIDAKGNRSLKIDSLSADRVEGLREFNQGLKLIIEGAAKAAK